MYTPMPQDCRYAFRMLRKNRGLSAAVANTAIFSVVDALLPSL